MSDRPILFSGPMVQALLREIEEPGAGKTMTRRVLKPQPPEGFRLQGIYAPGLTAVFENGNVNDDITIRLPSRGDRLWVRETFRQAYPKTSYSDGIVYRADAPKSLGMDEYSDRHKWRPSIFMTRRASRLTLTVTDVKVGRLRDISRGDAMSEGCPFPNMANGDNPRDWFAELWDSLNAKRGFGWDVNPWVTAATFKPHLRNIDSMDVTS